jgi:hypothetical protein
MPEVLVVRVGRSGHQLALCLREHDDDHFGSAPNGYASS